MDYDAGINSLKFQFPWPEKEPKVKLDLQGWFCGENMDALRRAIQETDASVVLELGAWKGLSTLFLYDHCPGTIISVDHWKGSAEHLNMPEVVKDLPHLYDIFVRNCWLCKDRIIPVKADTILGMNTIHSLGIRPEVIYVDASHATVDVLNDLSTIFTLFPEARIVGDDWTHKTVQDAVYKLQDSFDFDLKPFGPCYEITQ